MPIFCVSYTIISHIFILSVRGIMLITHALALRVSTGTFIETTMHCGLLKSPLYIRVLERKLPITNCITAI